MKPIPEEDIRTFRCINILNFAHLIDVDLDSYNDRNEISAAVAGYWDMDVERNWVVKNLVDVVEAYEDCGENKETFKKLKEAETWWPKDIKIQM